MDAPTHTLHDLFEQLGLKPRRRQSIVLSINIPWQKM